MAPVTPTSLPTTSPTDHPEGDRRGGRVAERVGRDGDPGVGQREERDDEVAGPRVQEVLEVLGDRDRLAEAEGDAAHLAGRHVAVGRQLAGDAVGVHLGEERSRRCQQAERDPGDGGVHPGLEHGEPHAEPEHDVDREVAHPGAG